MLELKHTWESLPGFPDAGPDDLPAEGWLETFVPGLAPHGWQGTSYARRLSSETGENIPCIWYRARFDVPSHLLGLNCILRIHRVRWGAKVWLNGSYLGEHLGEAPFSLDVPPPLLKQHRNELIFRLTGWPELPRNKDGQPMLPVGSARFNWGSKLTGVLDKVELEFYKDVLIDLVRVIPDTRNARALATIWARGNSDRTYEIKAAVIPVTGGKALSERTAFVEGDAKPVDLLLDIPDAQLWSPEHPFLYQLLLKTDGHSKTVTFGMREFTIRNGRFELNGKPITIRGSNLVHEWLGWDPRNALDPDNVCAYVINAARGMNVNAFRTHTQPMPSLWLDICDRNGMMVLAEFPLCFNYKPYGMTPDEMPAFRAKIEDEFRRLIKELWNHPSIVIWVPTNESAWKEDPYEDTVLYNLFKELDPSRPVLRSALPNPDILDSHAAASYQWPGDHSFYDRMEKLALQRDEKRHLSNSEYFSAAEMPSPKHFGPNSAPFSGRSHGERRPPPHSSRLIVAHHAALQTEALRRLRFDLILPYMFAYWSRGFDWQGEGRTEFGEAYHAFRNSLAPVGASLDLDEVPLAAGTQIELNLYVLNDTHSPVRFDAKLVALSEHPGFKPGSVPADAPAVWNGSAELPPFEKWHETLTWQVREEEGSSYLALVVEPQAGEPVQSVREIRSIRRDLTPLEGRTVAILDGAGDCPVKSWLAQHAVETVPFSDATPADVPVVVSGSDQPTAETQGLLRKHAEKGGTVLILARSRWDLPQVASASLTNSPGSNAFLTEAPGPLRPLGDRDLWHWDNPGNLVYWRLFETLPENAKVWAVGYSRTRARATWDPAVASLELGKGRMILCQLLIEESLNPSQRTDPIAERVLITLLTGSTDGASPHVAERRNEK